MAFTVLLDANVLYPAYLRDALLRLAYAEMFQIRWSQEILDEMARNVKAGRATSQHAKIDRTVETMKEAFPDAMVTGYERLIASMGNHPKDRHVLAAAIGGQADLIVTYNLQHFPPEARKPHDIDAQPPDEFLCYQWELEDPEYIVGILEGWAYSLGAPPLSLEELLEVLSRSAPDFSETVLRFVQSRTPGE